MALRRCRVTSVRSDHRTGCLLPDPNGDLDPRPECQEISPSTGRTRSDGRTGQRVQPQDRPVAECLSGPVRLHADRHFSQSSESCCRTGAPRIPVTGGNPGCCRFHTALRTTAVATRVASADLLSRFHDRKLRENRGSGTPGEHSLSHAGGQLGYRCGPAKGCKSPAGSL